MFRAFLGCSRAEFLFFRGKSENIMISRKKPRILICLEEHFLIYALKLAIYFKNHENITTSNFHRVKSLDSGKFGKSGWAGFLAVRTFLGFFCKISTPGQQLQAGDIVHVMRHPTQPHDHELGAR